MDQTKFLILLKNRGELDYQDKTEEVVSCRYDAGRYNVTFKNGKTFRYKYLNVLFLSRLKEIDIANVTICINGIPKNNVIAAYDFGHFIKIMYNYRWSEVYKSNSVTIEKSCLNNPHAKNCFAYLKRVSSIIRIKDSDERCTFLADQYSKISQVNETSVLSFYLLHKLPPKSNKNAVPIFPFGFNTSQKSATEKALTENVSIIEGPPGTGKTQTILNIIANIVTSGKSVAVVSNNNSATVNVQEKLKKNGLDFFTAFLGNRQNKDKFFSEQTGSYPDLSMWQQDSNAIKMLRSDLSVLQSSLTTMLEMQNRLAKSKQELADLQIEKQYFDDYFAKSCHTVINHIFNYKLKPDKILSLLIEYQANIENDGSNKVIAMFKLLIKYGFKFFTLRKFSSNEIILNLQKQYYERKKELLENEIVALSQRLENKNFEQMMHEYSQKSMTLFKVNLYQRYGKRNSRKKFEYIDLKRNFYQFVSEYPVVLSTTHSLRNCMQDNYLFDYLIIDEASQVDLVTGALVLSCAKKAVIVGDLKQLPNVITQNVKDQADQVFREFSLQEQYDYCKHSILSSFISLFSDLPKTLLKEHYRCHPQIIGFCNQKFYNNELVILTEETAEDNPLLIFQTVLGNHARRIANGDEHGVYNERQIDVILKEVLVRKDINNKKNSIGIVSPYRLQAEKLRNLLGNKTDIEADTVHKYQGREKDVIIITTVANEINNFVDNPNLINVAVSRAVKKLVIVISPNIAKQYGTNIGDLIRYVEYRARTGEVVNSNIYSVFDLLYSSYSDKLKEIMRNLKYVSAYKSENLMNIVIESVLALPKYNSFKHALHIPLKFLIKDCHLLTEEESTYAMNIMTHLDFVIYNKLNKKPLLAVEVDGVSFHENNSKQIERDRMKGKVLNKYGIPLLRIKTNESGEEEKLRARLDEIIGAS